MAGRLGWLKALLQSVTRSGDGKETTAMDVRLDCFVIGGGGGGGGPIPVIGGGGGGGGPIPVIGGGGGGGGSTPDGLIELGPLTAVG